MISGVVTFASFCISTVRYKNQELNGSVPWSGMIITGSITSVLFWFFSLWIAALTSTLCVQPHGDAHADPATPAHHRVHPNPPNPHNASPAKPQLARRTDINIWLISTGVDSVAPLTQQPYWEAPPKTKAKDYPTLLPAYTIKSALLAEPVPADGLKITRTVTMHCLPSRRAGHGLSNRPPPSYPITFS